MRDRDLAVLVELRMDPGGADPRQIIKRASVKGCTVDEEYDPVPMSASGTTIIRCHVADQQVIERLKRHPQVANVWLDTPIEPMTKSKTGK